MRKQSKTTSAGNDVPRLLTKNEVLALLNVANTTLHSWMSQSAFPLPIEISPGGGRSAMIAWLEFEVIDWVASRPRRQIGRKQYQYVGPQDANGTPTPRWNKAKRRKAATSASANITT